MCTVFDDSLGAFYTGLPRKSATPCSVMDNIDIVFAVIFMKTIGTMALIFLLCHRRTSKDGNIGIAGKVTRTTDTVHHLGSADVSRSLHCRKYLLRWQY